MKVVKQTINIKHFQRTYCWVNCCLINYDDRTTMQSLLLVQNIYAAKTEK